MSSLAGKNVIVVGAGGSGIAASRLAKREGASVVLVDCGRSESLERSTSSLVGEGIRVELGWIVPTEALACDLCVMSPGVSLSSPMGRYFSGLGCEVVSELEFGGRYCPFKKIGVTGTNGKTTVVEMLSHCLEQCGKRVLSGGNIGLPLSSIALSGETYDVLVVEVSSYQLETTVGFSTCGSGLLNITPDHLSRHGDMETYRDMKLRLLGQVEAGGTCVLRSDLLDDTSVCEALGGRRVVTFSGDEDADVDFGIRVGQLCRRGSGGAYLGLLPLESLPYSGVHNYENCLAVLALGESVGVSAEEMVGHLTSFRVGPHRMELVYEGEGVRFINDSKATNVDALVQSLHCQPYGERVALIAGGVAKGCDLSLALPAMRGVVSCAYLIGDCREQLKTSWSPEIECVLCDSFSFAVEGAYEHVRSGGGTVLLSPGCASQDMFVDYVERGRRFVELVSRLRGVDTK